MNIKLNAFFWLLRRQLALGKRRFWGQVVDAVISLFVSSVVFGHLFNAGTTATAMGPFIVVGRLTAYGFFKTAWKAMVLANEMAQGKMASQLVMPLPTHYVFAVRAIAWSLWDTILMLLGFVVGCVILKDTFVFSQVNWLKMLLMCITVNVFYGFFALWVASLLGGLVNSVWIYPRLINPLYMFGCSYYSWYMLHAKYNYLSWAFLLNPITYCLEGMRSTLLQTNQFLRMEVCFVVLWALIILFFWHAMRRFQYKFDLYPK